MKTTMYPFVPSSPRGLKLLRKQMPIGGAYIGQDGTNFYFLDIFNKPVTVPMSQEAKDLVAEMQERIKQLRSQE